METYLNIPVLTFEDIDSWELWLESNHMLETGIWMKIAKKGTGIASITVSDALDVCLCYGWIDGQRRSYDDTYFLQKYTPRRKRSLWSKINIGKIETLTAAGRMQEPGIKEITVAKADGRWDAAYESQKNATVPPDLEKALAQNEKANAFFSSLNKAEKYAVLWRLMTAKTPEVRVSRIVKMVKQLESKQKV